MNMWKVGLGPLGAHARLFVMCDFLLFNRLRGFFPVLWVNDAEYTK